ncbi:outer membrane transport energization protein TonB [Ruegeria halocynthiae]|uniref:Outer membrane transport energization protein TonB n=1 Tax=Ruegeria halocynthiae TaxID=985054 RepID=A0A1H2XYY1_9RHOB|nr:TonB family protein [Ruegeria halocynthiae]SDW98152.1 outer membrane transport energization protein TonB [Ruegeria halocynthiae]
MKHGLELCIFVILAITLHVLAFVHGARSGQQAAGSNGDAMVSIQAAAPTVVDMVKAWERSPVAMPILQDQLAAPQPIKVETPMVPQIELAPAPNATVRTAIVQPEIEQKIEVNITPPPPPEPEVEVKPRADTRPEPRPEQKQSNEGLKAKQTSVGRRKEIAAGSGGSTQAGAGNAKVTTGDPGKMAKLQAVWGAKIRARIDRNKRYPRRSKTSGDVTIELQVSRDGRLISYRLRKSSGVPELDKAAMDAVARARRFPKAPKELVGNAFRFRVPMKLARRQ